MKRNNGMLYRIRLRRLIEKYRKVFGRLAKCIGLVWKKEENRIVDGKDCRV